MKYFLLSLLFVIRAFGNDLTFDKETGQAIPSYVGQIKLIKGKVFKKKPQGKPVPVEQGERFNKNDTLITENKSLAKVLIVDDTELNIGPNTELNFQDLKYISKTDRKITYSLLRGQLRGHIKNKAKEDEVLFKTINATLGVRGTQILINHQQLKSIEVSEFALESGNATVIDELKKVRHDLTKDQKIIVLKDSVNNESALEKTQLSSEDFEVLKGEDNFMPFFIPSPGSALYGQLNQGQNMTSDEEIERSGKHEKKEAEPAGSFQNLKKLNEKLKEQQKQKN